MKTDIELKRALLSIDRRSYPAYKSLTGSWNFKSYILSVDHVQGDPFASPSHLTAHISLRTAGFPDEYLSERSRKTALSDYLLRRFRTFLRKQPFSAKGSGKSGLLSVSSPGQEILSRTACEITGREIAVRFFVGFPAAGRTILSSELEKILFNILPPCIEKSFIYKNIPSEEVRDVIALADDQEFLRNEIRKMGLAAFIADGSVLPRESGVSDRPMKGALPFVSPESTAVKIMLPSGKEIRGMGIKKGITLIAGGGYHGKSTVLKALERGVYNHIRGDGREYVITDDSAVKLRAEDGRKISDTDISMFIHDLPNKTDTSHFSTLDASGSTSQAANISEAIEADCKLLLIDEDTSATNFMIRDELMQKIISRDKEPITPFIERARQLFEEAGISSVIVVGSSGAYFYPADRIIQMDEYRPVDITDRVKSVIASESSPELYAPDFRLPSFNRSFRFLSVLKEENSDTRGINKRGPSRHGAPERMKLKMQGETGFRLGSTDMDLRYLEQLTDSEQTAAIAYLLRFVTENYKDSRMSRKGLIDLIEKRLEDEGFDFLFKGGYTVAGLAMPRRQELFAAFLRV